MGKKNILICLALTIWLSFIIVACSILLIVYQNVIQAGKLLDFHCKFENDLKGKCVPRENCTHPEVLEFSEKYDLVSNCEKGLDIICCPLEVETYYIDEPTTSEPSTKQPTERDSKLKLLNKKCGNNILIANRIVGPNKSEAEPGEFPFYVLLKYMNFTDNYIFGCGGSLISERYVLTAAHCIRTKPKLIAAGVGEQDLSKENDCEDCPPAVDYEIEKSIKHPKYIKGYNDIALIRLTENVKMSPFVKTICLPLKPENYLNTLSRMNFTVMGFGRMENGRRSEVLMKTNALYVPQEKCKAVFERQNFMINNDHLCAEGDGNDACDGDSGSPLIERSELNHFNRFFQYGLVSIGFGRCGEMPGINTKVENYVDWILENIE